MKLIEINNNDIPFIEDELCATIGNFDGLHLGHQLLISETKKHSLRSAIITFYPHPSIYLKKIKNYSLLTPLQKKKELIKKIGIDYLIIFKCSIAFCNMTKEDFILLLEKLHVKKIVCGYDFTFGYKALGSIRDLMKKFDTIEMPKFIYHNVRVSSTYIRELISNGEVKEAANLLGRYYSINGEIIHGNGIGNTYGVPTANVEYDKYYLPQNGVYAVKILFQNKIFFGMCNIGYNPTFNYSEKRKMEVNIFNFDSNIYGSIIEVFFYDKIRNERKFESKQLLIEQLTLDKLNCTKILNTYDKEGENNEVSVSNYIK